MSDKVPAFQFYPKDFLTDEEVRLMSHTERGIYITLLCLCWLHETLPGDLNLIAKLVQVPGVRLRKLWDGPIGQKFQLVDGRYRQRRLDQERQKQQEYRDSQAQAGKRGAEARWAGHGEPIATPLNQNGGATVSPLAKNGSPISDLRSPSSNKKPRADKPPNPDVSTFIRYFCELHLEHLHAKYLVNGGKDGQLVKGLLGTFGLERLKKLARVLVLAEDDWIAGTDRGIGVLHTKASWLDQRLAEAEASQKGAA